VKPAADTGVQKLRPHRSTLPAEAREGLMRAWLGILKERHPDVVWVAGRAANDEIAAGRTDGDTVVMVNS
jgi:hypothetical protein